VDCDSMEVVVTCGKLGVVENGMGSVVVEVASYSMVMEVVDIVHDGVGVVVTGNLVVEVAEMIP